MVRKPFIFSGLLWMAAVFQNVNAMPLANQFYRIEVVYGDKVSVFELKTEKKIGMLVFHSSDTIIQRGLSLVQLKSILTRIQRLPAKSEDTRFCTRKRITVIDQVSLTPKVRFSACLDGQTMSAQLLRRLAHLLAAIL